MSRKLIMLKVKATDMRTFPDLIDIIRKRAEKQS